MTTPQGMLELADKCELYAKIIEGIVVVADDWKPGDPERREPRTTLYASAQPSEGSFAGSLWAIAEWVNTHALARPAVVGIEGREPSKISDAELATWKDMARRDDWHMKFVGSDIRLMIQEIERCRAALARHPHQPVEGQAMNTRFINCEVCQTEGRILTNDGGPYDVDNGECPVCKGEGIVEIETDPVELEDIQPVQPVEDTTRKRCDWSAGEFGFMDTGGEHDPCYVVMPGGAMLELNHHAGEGVDIARAHFIVDACNAALAHSLEPATEAVILEQSERLDGTTMQTVRLADGSEIVRADLPHHRTTDCSDNSERSSKT